MSGDSRDVPLQWLTSAVYPTGAVALLRGVLQALARDAVDVDATVVAQHQNFAAFLGEKAFRGQAVERALSAFRQRKPAVPCIEPSTRASVVVSSQHQVAPVEVRNGAHAEASEVEQAWLA